MSKSKVSELNGAGSVSFASAGSKLTVRVPVPEGLGR